MNLAHKSTALLFVQFLSVLSYSQAPLPNIPITTSRGLSIPIKSIIDSNTITVISFWATWCAPCINELDALQGKIDEGEIKHIKLIAISTDEARTVQKIIPLAKSRGWIFDIYFDESNEVKRAFNVTNIPFIIIISKGKIIYQKSGYTPGDEEILIAEINHLNASSNK